ncbi:MAG TPA: hypothetical protein VGX48_03635 [Pyrinomonadaceae bacterium]|jgi:hypothetical protein|nr:hypothetical protein [Pyrinomonadaceae bacterium]
MNPDRNASARRPRSGILVVAVALLLLLAVAGTLQARGQEPASPDTPQEPTVSDLMKLPGKVIAESDSDTTSGKLKVRNYRVEELTLPAPAEVSVGGKRVSVTRAFRLTVTGGPFPVRALPPVLWVDDVAVGYGVESEDLDAITAVTFDESLLREGATIYLSYGDKENKHDRTALPKKLTLAKGGNQ